MNKFERLRADVHDLFDVLNKQVEENRRMLDVLKRTIREIQHSALIKESDAKVARYRFLGGEFTAEDLGRFIRRGTMSPSDVMEVMGLNGPYHKMYQEEEATAPSDEETSEADNIRADILKTAENLINGDRAQTYGDPRISFGRIAEIWNAQGYRRHIPDPNATIGMTKAVKLTATDAALLLLGMKLSRTQGGTDHKDNWVDLAGYAGLGAELASYEQRDE